MKLSLSDIKILTEGQQLERAILNKYPGMSREKAIEEFSNLADRSPSSVDRYARSSIIESKSFKIRAAGLLGCDFSTIFLNREEQIAHFIASIGNNISEYTSNEDIEVFERIRDMCIMYSYKTLLVEIYWYMAMYYKRASNLNVAAEYIKLAISLFDEFDYVGKIGLINLKSELGLIYLLDGRYKQAIEIFESLLCDEEKLRLLDSHSIFLIYYRLGICLLDLEEFNKSRKYLEKALSIAVNNTYRGHTLKNIGLIYKKQMQYKKALDMYDKALDFFGKDNKNISIILNNKAMLYREQGDLTSALDNINLAMNISESENEESLKYNYLDTYALIRIDLGEPMEALNLLLEMTERASETIAYKKNIYLGIKTLLDYAFDKNDNNIIDRIKNTLIYLIKKNPKTVDLQLKAFLGDILIHIEEVSI